jgi:hypothetical protein
MNDKKTYHGVRVLDYTVLGFDYGRDGDAASKADFDRAYAELEGISCFRTVNVQAGTWWLLVIAPDEYQLPIFEFEFKGEPVEVDDRTAETVVLRRLRTAQEEWDRNPTEHHFRQEASYGDVGGAVMNRDGSVTPLLGDDDA